MNINPQFIYDTDGRPANVVLTISEWQTLVAQGLITAPEWQAAENNKRLEAYRQHPEKAMEAEAFFEALEKENFSKK